MNTSRIYTNWFLALAIALFLSSALPAHSQDAASLFKTKCASCHGADGRGDTSLGKTFGAGDLTSDSAQKMTDDELSGIIAKGKNKMPAFGNSLKEADIRALVGFIRGLQKKK